VESNDASADALGDLAFDLRSAFNHETDALWERIAPDLWRESGNPWLVYHSASQDRRASLLRAPEFRALVERIRGEPESRRANPKWFQTSHSGVDLEPVAFFSLEFALSEALPLYSGGLGNVAGDYLKAADDLGVPMVGIGLLYRQGYFRQAIDAAGLQRDFFPFNDTRLLPVEPLCDRGCRTRGLPRCD
jgi:starch phosphorylase